MKIAAFTLLSLSLFTIVPGCKSPSQDMKNELKVVGPPAAPAPIPVGGLRDPSVRPVLKPVARGGIPDDSIRPALPNQRGGVADDGVRTLDPAPNAPLAPK
jgi:hypothetical protein